MQAVIGTVEDRPSRRSTGISVDGGRARRCCLWTAAEEPISTAPGDRWLTRSLPCPEISEALTGGWDDRHDDARCRLGHAARRRRVGVRRGYRSKWCGSPNSHGTDRPSSMDSHQIPSPSSMRCRSALSASVAPSSQRNQSSGTVSSRPSASPNAQPVLVDLDTDGCRHPVRRLRRRTHANASAAARGSRQRCVGSARPTEERALVRLRSALRVSRGAG